MIICFTVKTGDASYDPQVYQAQKALKKLGYDPGALDGLLGKATQSALEKFQHDAGLPATGRLDAATKAKLGIDSLSRGMRIGGQIKERRFALVIGNGAYKSGPLNNPENDAQDMAYTLEKLGFDVIHKQNADQRTMEDSIRVFGRRLRKGGVGLFYFAGHGMQINGRNYLIPVDARVETESDVKYEAVDAGRVLGKMEDADNRLNIVILDACRNNPFARGFRSAEKGLARMDAPTGSLIAYATAPGQVAADGEGRNGIFTKHLLNYITTPGLTVEQVLKRVRIGVLEETNSEQVPWESSSLTGNFYFASSGAGIEKPAGSTKTFLSVESNTQGAKVFVDGLRKGTTPLENVLLSPGWHTVLVEKPGYTPSRKRISVEAGRSVLLHVDLRPAKSLKGRLFVVTDPEEARIRILNIGSKFHQGIELDEGKYHIEVSADEYETKALWVTLRADEDKTVDVNLKWITGKKKFTIIAKNIEDKPGPPKPGEVIIQRRALPLAEVAQVSVSPKEVYAGEQFVIKARTSAAADKVSVEIEGKRYLMEGAGTEWVYLATVDRVGTSRYTVVALNADGKAGPVREERITLVKRAAGAVSVAQLEINPGKGYAGQKFTFKAATDRSAQQVDLVVAGKRYKMKGDDRQWSLAINMREIGSQEIEIIATNTDGVEGRPEKGLFVVEAHPVKVAKLQITPKTLYSGDDLVIQAVTDRPAKSVSLQMDGLTYEMAGSDKKWQFKRKERSAGKKKFTVIARNIEDKPGPPKPGTITIKQKPTRTPAVAAVSVSPEQVFIGQQFAIKVKTDIPAQAVQVAIKGKKHPMEGSGTSWHYTTTAAKAGKLSFKVSARNKEGRESKPKASAVTIAKKLAEAVRVATLELKPRKGYAGRKFRFKAETDRPVKKVSLVVGGSRYDMKGSGTKWALTQKITKPGDLQISAMAINEDGVEGAIKTALLTVVEKVIAKFKCNKDGTVTNNETGRVRFRFVDNGDGTVTDLCTDLMWSKQPKREAVTWWEARDYCRQLNDEKYKGWRLPTLREMSKLIDKRQRDPALPVKHPFSEVHTDKAYWTKTDSRPPIYVYQVELSRGRKQSASKKRDANVWPVRYAK